MQRWVWDVHYPPLQGPRTFEIAAIYHDTPTSPLGPSAPPGEYTVKLTVNGASFTQPLTLKMDPRVVTPANGIAKMFEISHGSYDIVNRAREAQASVRDLRAQLQAIRQRAGQGQAASAIAAFDAKLAAIAGPAATGRRGRRGATRPATETSFGSLANAATSLMSEVEAADALPTEAASKNYEQTSRSFDDLSARWAQISQKDLPELNARLKAAGLPAVTAPSQ